uniref:Uncharacterized protein n=4 Tax=Triticinae TaxID=1648030 RepID=A0A453QXC1_AEGTS
MRICENHLDQGGAIGSCMDILVGILHMRKGRKGPRHTLSLRLNVSDDVEVFISGMHPFSYYEASSKMHMDLGLETDMIICFIYV